MNNMNEFDSISYESPVVDELHQEDEQENVNETVSFGCWNATPNDADC